MTFNFNPSLDDNASIVRFHIGDTDEDGYYLENETIDYLLSAEGTVGGAVIASIKYILSQLSKPDFRLDWMAVSNMADARAGYEALLKQKRAEFGLRQYTPSTSIKQPYRLDSLQDSSVSTYDPST